MQKYIKIGIIFLIVLGVLVGLKYLLTPSMDLQMKNILLKNGFAESSDTLFIKKTDDGENSFSLADYTYMQKNDKMVNGVETYLYKIYNYKDKKITYTYRITYQSKVNILFRGNYTKDNFVCEKEFSTGTLTTSEKESFCNLAKLGCETFSYEAENLFTNKYKDYIRNKN